MGSKGSAAASSTGVPQSAETLFAGVNPAAGVQQANINDPVSGGPAPWAAGQAPAVTSAGPTLAPMPMPAQSQPMQAQSQPLQAQMQPMNSLPAGWNPAFAQQSVPGAQPAQAAQAAQSVPGAQSGTGQTAQNMQGQPAQNMGSFDPSYAPNGATQPPTPSTRCPACGK